MFNIKLVFLLCISCVSLCIIMPARVTWTISYQIKIILSRWAIACGRIYPVHCPSSGCRFVVKKEKERKNHSFPKTTDQLWSIFLFYSSFRPLSLVLLPGLCLWDHIVHLCLCTSLIIAYQVDTTLGDSYPEIDIGNRNEISITERNNW